MSKIQDGVAVGDCESSRAEPIHDEACSAEAATSNEPRMQAGAGRSEGSLLSRPAAPHYRRSLFRC